ncbi:MAG: hypothetical protein QXJ19_07530 [Candidatus Bathyarchaeia archaeon]
MRIVNIRPIKAFAAEKLPQNNPLRLVLLLEDDEMDAAVFLARLSMWLKLARTTLSR